jgi:type I restriction enzyme, R subunit
MIFQARWALLRDKKFQHLLLNYERPKREFLIGYEVEDAVTSEVMIRAGSQYQKPEDYLDSFARFVRENPDHIEAIQILLQKPREWKAEILSELRKKLAQNNYPEKELQKAHKLVLNKALADIISMIKHTAAGQEPIYTAEGRVDRALKKVMIGKSFNEEQLEWLEFIRQHLIANLSIAMEDFDYAPVFERHGGKGKANKVFGGGLEFLVAEINYAIAA